MSFVSSKLTPIYTIKPKGLKLDIKDLIAYKDLIFLLVFRDIKIRYVQSILGVGWAVIQPLFSMLIFTFIFGNLAKIPSGGVPYPLFSYMGLVPWVYFSSALSDASSSLVSNSTMIGKIYFPRLILPIACILSKSLDFFISLSLSVLLFWYYGIFPSSLILYLPLLITLLFLNTLAFSFWLSALCVKYRDVRYGLGFFLQLFQYLTPVVYPYAMIPPKWQFLYALNPMVGIIEGFRSCLSSALNFPFYLLGLSTISVFILFISGFFYFKNSESSFADVV